MTQEPTDKTAPDAAPAETADTATSHKALWAGVGIGSAAIIAALMYTGRPKKRRK